MFGLMVLAALAAYFAISVGVVLFVVLQAKKRGRSPVLWGIVTGLVMYNLVFWDYLPTLIVFTYKCHTESGFWVYKTPEQWKIENPGVAETLTWQENSPYYKAPGVLRGYKINERIGWVFVEHGMPILNVITQEELIIDLKNKETLVKRVRIYSGDGPSNQLRFWIHHRQLGFKINEFNMLWHSYKGLGKEKK